MKFTKMVAAGNDFIIFNGFEYTIKDYEKLALRCCDRHFSVGGDGIMICEKSSWADIKMVYYNSDGSEGEMCGNGIRCFAKYVYENKLIDIKTFTIETLSGIKTVELEIDKDNKVTSVKVNMGYPIFESAQIPVDINKKKVLLENLNIGDKKIQFSSVLAGVPHTVIFVDNIKEIDINSLGRKIESNKIFPKKTNVNFVEIIDKGHINIYTWERGAGRTLGCGTGSCASVVIGNILGKLNKKVEVNMEGGKIQVCLNDNYDIYMKGSAETICIGEFLNL